MEFVEITESEIDGKTIYERQGFRAEIQKCSRGYYSRIIRNSDNEEFGVMFSFTLTGITRGSVAFLRDHSLSELNEIANIQRDKRMYPDKKQPEFKGAKFENL